MIEPVSRPRPRSVSDFESPPTVYVRGDVLDELRYGGQWRTSGLSGALLVGSLFRDAHGDGDFLIVDGFVGGMHVADLTEFTRALRREWKQALAARAEHLPDGQIVGWSVAPSEESIELDRGAVVLHNTFFNHDWQRGLWVPDGAPPVWVRPDGDAVSTGPVAVLDRTGARPAKGR